MLILCRNLYYFKCCCIADHLKVSRLTSQNTYYIGCVFYCIEASKTHEAVLPQLLMRSTTQIQMKTVGLRWNWHHWSIFHMSFHWQIRCSKSYHTNLRTFQLYTHVCYGWIWTIQRWNLSCRISRTRFKFSNIVSNHVPSAGRGRVWGLRLLCSLCLRSPTLLP